MGEIVRVEPLGIELNVRDGETLIEAAWREGYFWPTVCFGQARCTACNVEVVDGGENTSQVAAEEEATLRLLRVRGGADLGRRRLACRLMVDGPVVVRKQGVRLEGGT
jgi:ferredoxin, 2Fe-2S